MNSPFLLEYLERLQEGYLDHLQKSASESALVVDLGQHDLLQDKEAYEEVQRLLGTRHAPGYKVVQL